MRYPKPETLNARLVLNERITQKVRLAALAAISRPSLRLLYRLLNDPTTPSRLLALATGKVWPRNATEGTEEPCSTTNVGHS
jgi:hypothetical protein